MIDQASLMSRSALLAWVIIVGFLTLPGSAFSSERYFFTIEEVTDDSRAEREEPNTRIEGAFLITRHKINVIEPPKAERIEVGLRDRGVVKGFQIGILLKSVPKPGEPLPLLRLKNDIIIHNLTIVVRGDEEKEAWIEIYSKDKSAVLRWVPQLRELLGLSESAVSIDEEFKEHVE